MSVYEILSATPGGIVNGVLDRIIRCTYARSVNNIGEMTLILPDVYPIEWFIRDARVYIQKGVGSNTPVVDLETSWFIQDITAGLSADGRSTVELHCVDAIAILSYFIVPYNANNTEIPGSLKLQEADDMMKAIVRENMGSLASDTNRNISEFLAVQEDSSAAPILKKEFSKRIVLDVLKELADSSAEQGTYLAFDVVLTDALTGALEFRTYVGQRGNDHRFPGGSPPVLMDAESDTLSEIALVEGYENQKTYVYVGGAGLGDIRPVTTASDDEEIASSPFGRREIFVDMNNTTDVDVLEAEASAALKKNEATEGFSARLNDQATIIRGIHWNYGDFLSASYKNRTFDVHADKIAITINEDGTDKTEAILSSTGKAISSGGPFVRMFRKLNVLDNAVKKLESIELPGHGWGWYNVMDQGALGDGTTNDTAAIQATIDLAEAAGGGLIYFPPGTYSILSQMTVVLPGSLSRITLMGAPGATLSLGADLANNDTPMIDVSNSGGALVRCWFTVLDLKFEGNSHTGTGLKTNSLAERTTIERCWFHDFDGRGLWAYGSIGINIIGSHFITCGTGCDIDGTTSQGEGAIVGSKFESCVDVCLNLNDGITFMEIIGCTFYGSVPHKVEVADGAYSIGFRACSFEDAATEGSCLWFVGSASEITIEDCQFQANATSTTQYGIKVIGNLTNSFIAQNSFILIASSTKTCKGIDIDGARTDLRIGPNRFSTSGAGTLVTYEPADLPYPDIDLGGARISSYAGTTGSIANTANENIFTSVNSSIWLVTAMATDGTTTHTTSLIQTESDGGTNNVVINNAGGVTITNSGTTVRVTNNSGGSKAFTWAALRIK